jgi:hypothetical protein
VWLAERISLESRGKLYRQYWDSYLAIKTKQIGQGDASHDAMKKIVIADLEKAPKEIKNQHGNQAFRKKIAAFARMGMCIYKSSDCPVCPICRKRTCHPQWAFFRNSVRQQGRALEGAGITTLELLSKYSEKEILKLHGMVHQPYQS